MTCEVIKFFVKQFVIQRDCTLTIYPRWVYNSYLHVASFSTPNPWIIQWLVVNTI